MNTRKCLGTMGLSLALILASGISGFAKGSQTIALSRNIAFHGTTLPAGEYVIQWQDHNPGATVEFKRGRKVILTAEGTIEDRHHKFDRNSVVYAIASDGVSTISEIRFAGSSQVLVFNR